jgi:hypothetical protein
LRNQIIQNRREITEEELSSILTAWPIYEN